MNTFQAPSDMFCHQTLELTFRVLRNKRPQLAHLIKMTMDQIHYAPTDIIAQLTVEEMHMNAELIERLGAEQIIKIVAALTHIGEAAVIRKDLPPYQINILRNLINDWVALSEWLLQHATLEKSGAANQP